MLKRELIDYGDPATLQAGGGSIIELVLGVPDIDIPNLASKKPADPFASAFFSAFQNLHNSISAAGLRNRTKVTTATIAGALGESYPPSRGLFDPACQSLDPPFQYPNFFVAMSDAFYSALERGGGGSLEIVVSESGWPSAGGGPETNIDNARIYSTNLVQLMKNGTTKRPGKPIETYIFATFDENQKQPESEKFRGLFLPSKQPKYPIQLN
ncbi:hypothetical protein H0E87_027237 [Populus deltoides]|uniref:glucan endo-1,3-beta-D-glucosidase n=1 Tax=Populus deltoides TaxID=3696 RepID=A0A8T2X0Q7_POPDE|nr:hypothetical protein H0E87_027237 [Populus deltoides]